MIQIKLLTPALASSASLHTSEIPVRTDLTGIWPGMHNMYEFDWLDRFGGGCPPLLRLDSP